MSTKPTVMKFGGTSVEDGPALARLARIVRAHESLRPVVVVSAMRGVTDALLTGFRKAAAGEVDEAVRRQEQHFERHLEVARSFKTGAQAEMRSLIRNARQEIAELLLAVADNESLPAMPNEGNRPTSAQLYDLILSYGERLSARLTTEVLNELGLPAEHVDARQCIVTDDQHGNAKPLTDETWCRTQAKLEPLLAANKIPVLGGFIASSRSGRTTTLGRGSSDYTATLVSAALQAREAQIWSDVNGVLTADPGLVKTAGTVPELSYKEAAALARFGTKVMHQSMIQPALELGIPVRICNSRTPEKPGTTITARSTTTAGTIKAIAHKTGLTGIKITSTPAFVANGFMHTIEQIFNRHCVDVDLVGKSHVGISLACRDTNALPFIVHDLEQLGAVEVKANQAIVSCVGDGLCCGQRNGKQTLNVVKNVDPTLTWHRASDISILSLIDAGHVNPIVTRLHRAIFEA
jgi:aspartate kinase